MTESLRPLSGGRGGVTVWGGGHCLERGSLSGEGPVFLKTTDRKAGTKEVERAEASHALALSDLCLQLDILLIYRHAQQVQIFVDSRCSHCWGGERVRWHFHPSGQLDTD